MDPRRRRPGFGRLLEHRQLSAVGRAGLSAVKDPRVTFDASGPAGMKIEGTTSDLTVTDGGDNVVITVPLAN